MSDDAWSGPLFIVGASRSGTAMLRSALNRHSAIKLAFETRYFEDLRTRQGLARKGRLDAANAAVCADYFRALDVRPHGMRGNPDLSPNSREELISRASEMGGDVLMPSSRPTAGSLRNAKGSGYGARRRRGMSFT